MKTTFLMLLAVILVFFYSVSSTTIWQDPLGIVVRTEPIATVAESATVAVTVIGETAKMQTEV